MEKKEVDDMSGQRSPEKWGHFVGPLRTLFSYLKCAKERFAN